MEDSEPISNVLYMARQPILDAGERIAGYELLYRAAAESSAIFSDINAASHSVLEQIVILGCRELSGGKRLYVNCTGPLLVEDYVSVLPPESIVVEILESVEPADEVLEACRRLKRAGFTIALDDFVPSPLTLPFLPFADIVKVDFRSTDEETRARIVSKYCRKVRALAEKVETRAEFQSALDAGFTLFQGYFFCQPVLLASQQLLPTRLNRLRLVEQICRPDLNFSDIENVIKEDAALCFRLLRYLNSCAFCLRTRIDSVRHALSLLGEHQIRKWVAVACVSFATEGSSPSSLSAALLRAHTGELLASRARCRPYDMFIVGLFSTMDVLLGMPLERILAQVTLPKECAAALTGEHNRLRDVLDLIVAWERGDWAQSLDACRRLGLDPEDLADAYLRSLQWVDSVAAMNENGAGPEPELVSAGHGRGNGLRPV